MEREMTGKLSHIDSQGNAKMVNVGEKKVTGRTAAAQSRVSMDKNVFEQVAGGTIPKGDVLSAVRIAGIQAAKRTYELIPLCHPLQIESVAIDITPDSGTSSFCITAKVSCSGKTGVEMEAMTAASVAALTLYDMCKSLDRSIEITDIYLLRKSGGKSGTYIRPGHDHKGPAMTEQ